MKKRTCFVIAMVAVMLSLSACQKRDLGMTKATGGSEQQTDSEREATSQNHTEKSETETAIADKVPETEAAIADKAQEAETAIVNKGQETEAAIADKAQEAETAMADKVQPAESKSAEEKKENTEFREKNETDYYGEEVELVNRKGDLTTAYQLSDGTYTDHEGRHFTFDGVDAWIDGNGAEWNQTVD